MCAVVGVEGSDPTFIFPNILLYNNVLSMISWLDSI